MATPYDNANCHHMQNDPKCKIKLLVEKFRLTSSGIAELG